MEQKKEKVFADGIIFKKPQATAPEFVKGKISIKTPDFMAFLHKHSKNGWVNLDLKKSAKTGNLYFELDTWTKDDGFKSTLTEKEKEDIARLKGGQKEHSEPIEDDINPEDIPF